MGERIDDLHVVLAVIGKEIGSVQKTGKMAAAAGGFGFVQHHEVVAKASPLLHDAGILVVPRVTSTDIHREGKTTHAVLSMDVAFERGHDDAVTCSVACEGKDSSDKAVSKAMTQGLKKAYMTVLGLAVDEGLDSAYQEKRAAPSQRASPRDPGTRSHIASGTASDNVARLQKLVREKARAMGVDPEPIIAANRTPAHLEQVLANMEVQG